MSPPGLKVCSMLLGKSKELLTFPEAAGPKQKQYPVVDASGEESKIWCCKEQCYCVGTMNQGKLDMAKQEMVRINIYIFRNQWTKMGSNGQI